MTLAQGQLWLNVPCPHRGLYWGKKPVFGFLAVGNARLSVASESWKFQTVLEPTNKDVPSALPKQLPRCDRKLLQAVAMASSAETTVLIIRSSTLAISAARRGGKGGKKKKKNGKSKLWSSTQYLEKHDCMHMDRYFFESNHMRAYGWQSNDVWKSMQA